MWLSNWSTRRPIQQPTIFIRWYRSSIYCHSILVLSFNPSWMSTWSKTHWKFMIIKLYTAFVFTIVCIILDRISLSSSTCVCSISLYVLAGQYCFQRSVNQTGLMVIFTLPLWQQVLLLLFVTLGQELLGWASYCTMSSVHSWLWPLIIWICEIKWIMTMKMWNTRFITLIVFPNTVSWRWTTTWKASSFRRRIVIWTLWSLFVISPLWHFIFTTLPSIFKHE